MEQAQIITRWADKSGGAWADSNRSLKIKLKSYMKQSRNINKNNSNAVKKSLVVGKCLGFKRKELEGVSK